VAFVDSPCLSTRPAVKAEETVNIRFRIFFSVFLTVFFCAFIGVFMLVPFYYGHPFFDLGRFKGATTLATIFFLLYSLIAAGIAVALHAVSIIAEQRFRRKIRRTIKALFSFGLAFLFVLSVVYDVHTSTYSCCGVSENNAFLGKIGNWDVKGFEWSEPNNTYPSGFSYAYENNIITVWVGDWEHDYYQGITVGAVRQGSVWDLATAPWYDQTTYQPAPLHFEDKSSVVLTARVRIDSQQRTGLGWINWLFNPWFRVQSTYGGVTKERKMVWDIVWGWNSFAGFSNTQDFIDEDENLHLVFFMPVMAQNGEWKTFSIDMLKMAEEARNRLIPLAGRVNLPIKEIWKFEVNSLYLWSVDVCVEGFDYDTQFSVDYLRVNYMTQGRTDSYAFVSSWGDEG
jgi:hypothetical protein